MLVLGHHLLLDQGTGHGAPEPAQETEADTPLCLPSRKNSWESTSSG